MGEREILPCPFCGGEAKSNRLKRGRTFVWCPACSTSPTPINDWNRRATHPAVAALRELVVYLNDRPSRIAGAGYDETEKAIRTLEASFLAGRARAVLAQTEAP